MNRGATLMHGRTAQGCAVSLLAILCVTADTSGAAAKDARSVTKTALEPFVERSAIAGAVVMIVSTDQILEYEAIGYADLSSKRPMAKDALFWITSTSKPFVGTAMMMLVEEGRIGLDDPVTRFLPD